MTSSIISSISRLISKLAVGLSDVTEFDRSSVDNMSFDCTVIVAPLISILSTPDNSLQEFNIIEFFQLWK